MKTVRNNLPARLCNYFMTYVYLFLGKGQSIWDHEVHQKPSIIFNDATGDVATDFYHKYKEDIKLAKSIGVSESNYSLLRVYVHTYLLCNIVSQMSHR